MALRKFTHSFVAADTEKTLEEIGESAIVALESSGCREGFVAYTAENPDAVMEVERILLVTRCTKSLSLRFLVLLRDQISRIIAEVQP